MMSSLECVDQTFKLVSPVTLMKLKLHKDEKGRCEAALDQAARSCTWVREGKLS